MACERQKLQSTEPDFADLREVGTAIPMAAPNATEGGWWSTLSFNTTSRHISVNIIAHVSRAQPETTVSSLGNFLQQLRIS